MQCGGLKPRLNISIRTSHEKGATCHRPGGWVAGWLGGWVAGWLGGRVARWPADWMAS